MQPDLVLIYQKPDSDILRLVRLGSHSVLGLQESLLKAKSAWARVGSGCAKNGEQTSRPFFGEETIPVLLDKVIAK